MIFLRLWSAQHYYIRFVRRVPRARHLFYGFNKLKTGSPAARRYATVHYMKLQSAVFVVAALKLIRHLARGEDGAVRRGILIERCTRALIKFLHPLDNIDFLRVRRKFNSTSSSLHAVPIPSVVPPAKSRIENLRTVSSPGKRGDARRDVWREAFF